MGAIFGLEIVPKIKVQKLDLALNSVHWGYICVYMKAIGQLTWSLFTGRKLRSWRKQIPTLADKSKDSRSKRCAIFSSKNESMEWTSSRFRVDLLSYESNRLINNSKTTVALKKIGRAFSGFHNIGQNRMCWLIIVLSQVYLCPNNHDLNCRHTRPNFSQSSSRIALVYQLVCSRTIADWRYSDWIADKKFGRVCLLPSS